MGLTSFKENVSSYRDWFRSKQRPQPTGRPTSSGGLSTKLTTTATLSPSPATKFSASTSVLPRPKSPQTSPPQNIPTPTHTAAEGPLINTSTAIPTLSITLTPQVSAPTSPLQGPRFSQIIPSIITTTAPSPATNNRQQTNTTTSPTLPNVASQRPSLNPTPSPQTSPASQNPVVQNPAQTLWEQAINKIDPEDLKCIDLQQDKNQILNDLLQATEQKKKDCESKAWSYKDRHGEQKLVRESVGTFLVNLKKITPIGDTIINTQPAIVSAAWGGFKFLLQVVTAGVENLRVIFESLDNLTRILMHCSIYEDLYTQTKLKVTPLLQDSLINLYVSILEYLCYVWRHLGRNTAVQYLQSTWEGVWMGLDERLQKIAAGEAGVAKDADVAAKEGQNKKLEELAKCLAEVKEPIRRIERTVADIYKTIEDDERLRILNWLSKVSFREHHRFISSSRHPETGEWLMGKPHFLDWKDPELSSLLWLHGIAGSGKTMLASKIIDVMEPKQKEHSLAYFYCNYKEAGRRDPASILRALVKQLCLMSPEETFPAPMLSIYKQRKKDADLSNLLSVDEIKVLLVDLSAGFLQTTIVIDALDECDRDTRGIIFDVLEHVMSAPKNPVKIFVTSRDDGDLRRRLENSPNVYIQEGDNLNDICRYIDSEIHICIKTGKLLEGEVDDTLKAHIIEALRKGARGMFIWVKYQILMICEETTKKGVEKALTELPKDLDETYSEILRRIENRNRSPRTPAQAKNVLTWILSATRPLSPEELIEAISVEPMASTLDTDGMTMSRILDICQNLVLFDEKLNVFRFVHFSVQEFLLDRLKLEECHAKAAEVCLTLLTHHHATSSPQTPALLDYSTFNWPIHVRSSSCGSETLKSLWVAFLKPHPAYKAWVLRVSEKREFRDLRPEESKTLAPLLVACYYQLSDIFKFLLDAGADPNSYNRNGCTSLHLAAKNGNEHATRLLLEKEGVDVDSKSRSGRTPLSWAAENGHEKVVQMLLEKEGVDVDSKYNSGRTPLSWAAENGCEKVVQMLLEKEGVDVNSKDEDGQTPLSWAAGKAHKSIIELLKCRGAKEIHKEAL